MDTYFLELLLAWPLLVAALVAADRRFGRSPLFLCNSYIAGLAVNHWFGALVHALPGHTFKSFANTIAGFEATTWGLLFFVLGVAVTPNAMPRDWRAGSSNAAKIGRNSARTADRAAIALLWAGLVAWMAAATTLMTLPSVSSIISGGKHFLVAGICLKCWLHYRRGNLAGFGRWLGVGAFFPIYTTLSQGFIGFGISIFMTIIIFVGSFYRPRWQVFVAATVVVFFGLSLWVAYFEHRKNVRETVWGGQGLELRLAALGAVAESFVPFDFDNPAHLRAVDERLNQNELVGAALNFVPTYKDFAGGQTVIAAIEAALIPRALWPDKPVVGGSQMITEYTGIQFGPDVSVGVGPVIEYYVNYGWTGLAAGFFLFGVVLRRIDFRVARGLLTDSWGDLAFWFPIGASLLQPIGSLVEISSSAAGAAIIGAVVKRFINGPRRRNVRVGCRKGWYIAGMGKSLGAHANMNAGRPVPGTPD
jgi:hypothetical protein